MRRSKYTDSDCAVLCMTVSDAVSARTGASYPHAAKCRHSVPASAATSAHSTGPTALPPSRTAAPASRPADPRAVSGWSETGSAAGPPWLRRKRNRDARRDELATKAEDRANLEAWQKERDRLHEEARADREAWQAEARALRAEAGADREALGRLTGTVEQMRTASR